MDATKFYTLGKKEVAKKKNLCFWLSQIHLAVIIICKVLWTISTRASMPWYQPWCRCYTGSNTGFSQRRRQFLPQLFHSFFPPLTALGLIFRSSLCPLLSVHFVIDSAVHNLPPSLLIQSLTRTIKARLCVFVSPIVTIFSFLLFLLGMLCHTLYVPLFLFFLYGSSFFWFCRHFSLVFILFS